MKCRLLCFMTFPRCLQLSGRADRHEQPLRGRCAGNASSPGTAAGPIQAGWQGRVGGTSRRPLLSHPASSTAPGGRVTAELRPAARPEVSPRIRAHAAPRRRSQRLRQRPATWTATSQGGDSLLPPCLFLPDDGGLSSLTLRGERELLPAPWVLPLAPRAPACLLPLSRTPAEMDRGRLNRLN